MPISSDERRRIQAAQMARNRRDSVFSCGNRAMKSDITLTLEKEDFVAGDVIAGTVCVTLTQEVKVKDLLLKVTGQSRVYWDETRAYTKGAAAVVSRKNSETYIDHTIVLLRNDKLPAQSSLSHNKRKHIRSSPAVPCQDMALCPSPSQIFHCPPEADEGVLIPPGEHKFHFEFTLPRDLPSTFAGKWGNVRYSVKTVLERPWKFDIEREKDINVAANLDLNEEPELLRPVSALSEFSSGFLCFGAGLVNLEVRLSRRGYIPGEDIPFHVVIENNTGQKLHAATMSLVQHVTFKAGEKTKKLVHVLASTTKGEICAWKTDHWENQRVTIPSDTLPSTSKHVQTIQIKYTITLTIAYSTWRDEFSFPVPVFVGTQPFRKAVVQSYLHLLGYNITPRSSPNASPKMGPTHKHNGNFRGRSSSKPTIPSSLVALDQLRMRRASAIPGLMASSLPADRRERFSRLDSNESARSNNTADSSPTLGNNNSRLSGSQPIHSSTSSLASRTKKGTSSEHNTLEKRRRSRDLIDATNDEPRLGHQHHNRKHRSRGSDEFEKKTRSLERHTESNMPLDCKVRVESFGLQTRESEWEIMDAITECET